MRLRRALVALVALFAPLFGLAQLNTTRVMDIGRNALYFEDYVLSIQYFNKVIDAKPFLHEPYFFRGLAKFYLDDFVGAGEDLTQAINRNPYIARSYQLRGLCRANLDSLELAEQDIRTAIKYDPQNNTYSCPWIYDPRLNVTAHGKMTISGDTLNVKASKGILTKDEIFTRVQK